MYHPEINITDEERERIIESAKELLTKKKVVVHHAKHEYRFAKVCWKFTPNITDDTMYLAYILYMSYPGISYGLKYLSGRFISMPPWEEDVHLYSEVFKKINKYKELTKDKMENLIQEYKKLNLTEEELIRFDNILKDKNYPIRQAESDKSDVFYWMVPVKSLEKYAGYDAVAPLKLMKVLKPMLVKDSGLVNVYDLMMRASNAFANVELMGFRINDLELWTKRYQDEIDKALKAIREFDEVKKFELETGSEYNPSSSQQNVEVFFHKFQFPVKGTTSKGEPSTSETHIIAMIMELQAIENRSPDEEKKLKFLEEFRRYKKLKKLMSSYFIGLREFMRYNDAYDGHKHRFVPEPPGVQELHMHPGYTLHGTETGRLSSQNPSLHTIPTNSEVKNLLVPNALHRGGLFVMADYSQAELRVLASCVEKFYGDSSMADAYRAGKDIHRVVASKVFNKPEEEILDAERRFSKTISFSLTYGSSEASVAESTGRTPEEVHDLFKMYYSSFPGVQSFIDAMHAYATKYGCVRTPTGRIRHIPAALDPNNRGAYSTAMRQAQNSPIQGGASDIAVNAVVIFDEESNKKGMDSKVVGTVHDSIYVDIAPGELFESMDLLHYAMKTYPESHFDFLTCPLGVDLELSDNLGDHAAVKEQVLNDDGSRVLTLKGYDYVVNNIVDALKVSYDVEDELIKEEPFDTGDASLIARRVINLAHDGKFTMHTRKITVKPRK